MHGRPLPRAGRRGGPRPGDRDRAGVRPDPRRAGRRAAGSARSGFESDQVTVDAHAALAEETEGTAALVRAPGLVQQLRMVKDDAELAALRTACAIADAAFAELIDARRARARPHRSRGRARPGVPHAGARRGGPVLRVDRRGGPALGRAAPQPDRDPAARRRLREARLRRARRRLPLRHDAHGGARRPRRTGSASCTRWSPPRRRRAGPRSCPGVDVADVDAAARGVVVDAGRGEQFLHPLGHGVGLQIHEAPLLGATGIGSPGRGHGRHRGARRLPRGPRRCADRGHARRHATARPRCSPGSPRICWRSDRAILDGGRRRAPQISARAAHPGACSPRATDERRSHTPWPPRTTSRTDWC